MSMRLRASVRSRISMKRRLKYTPPMRMNEISCDTANAQGPETSRLRSLGPHSTVGRCRGPGATRSIRLRASIRSSISIKRRLKYVPPAGMNEVSMRAIQMSTLRQSRQCPDGRCRVFSASSAASMRVYGRAAPQNLEKTMEHSPRCWARSSESVERSRPCM